MSEKTTKADFSVKTLIFILISWVLLFGSYLTYTIVPASELANGIEHSGMDAVYVLILSPVFAFISLVMLALTLFFNKDYLFGLINKTVSLIACGVLAVMTVVSIVLSVVFVVSQYDLGFTAPVDGTVYESYGVFMLINVIAQAVAIIAISLKMKGITFIKK